MSEPNEKLVPTQKAKNWNDLSDNLKEMVVDQMDIVTRFRLKLCSKSDKCLVEKVPFECDSIDARFGFSGPARHMVFQELRISSVLINWDKSTKTISIKNHENNNEKLIKLASEEEGPEMIRCMFHAFMMPQNVRIGCFSTDLEANYLFPTPAIKLRAKCLDLDFFYEDSSWLDVLAETPEELTVRAGWEDIGEHPVVQNVKCLEVSEHSDIENEHLMSFKATNLRLEDSNVREWGINEYIKKLITDEKEYPVGSKMNFADTGGWIWDELIHGLDYEHVEAPDEQDSDADSDDGGGGPEFDGARVQMSPEKDIIVALRAYYESSDVTLYIVKKDDFPY